MSTYTVSGISIPVCGELEVEGHKIPVLDLKEVPDKLWPASGEVEEHDLSD